MSESEMRIVRLTFPGVKDLSTVDWIVARSVALGHLNPRQYHVSRD
jgi:hypothetical protein